MKSHIYNHKGIREYEGDETGNLVLGQGGVDLLSVQNDIVTAGVALGSTNLVAGADVDLSAVKGWVGVTALGNSSATVVLVTLQVKSGTNTYTDLSISMPIGTTLYGAFHSIKITSSITNGVALWCIRG